MLQNKASRIWAVALVALALCAAAPATQAHANPLDAIASFFGFGAEEQAEPAASGELGANIVVDGDSSADWSDLVGSSTENIGRIWTDKSVYDKDVQLPGGEAPEIAKGDSDFLVGLSALSSMSNITTTTSSPLDIVMVLDTSGSMEDNTISIYDYTETYEVRTDLLAPAYYAKNADGSYSRVERVGTGITGIRFDHWELGGKTVNPKTSADDATEGRIQFYTRETTSSMSLMGALQVAAKNFVDMTLEANGSINNEDQKHRISVVRFSSENDAEALTQLLTVDSRNANTLKDEIDGLRGEGGTYPDDGFNVASEVLQSNPRDNSQKVVLFFTDGGPGGTDRDPFNPTVANSAVRAARSLKQEPLNATLYSIGTFADADPSDLDSEMNQFMNAVSSNFPTAQSYTSRGERVPSDENYYFAVTEDQGLSEIFEKIFQEVSQGSGSPTEIHSGSGDPLAQADEDGYVTFTDRLGDYMQVDEFKTVVFADKKFENPTKSTNGLVDTYTFTGTVQDSDLYPNASMDKLVINVTRSDSKTDLRTGDIVEVKIPASLIPLRNFKVYPENDNPDNKTSSVTETYPIRIYYGVSPKAGVKDRLANPDNDMLEYIQANKSADNKTISFLSNAWAGGATGNTIANFEPASGNSYYYFTENTRIYTDESCATQATSVVPGNDYWYQRTYYTITDGKAVEGVSKYKFAGDSAVAVSGAVAYDRDGAYFTAGAPRLTYIEELSHQKGADNKTQTAEDVINPEWNNDTSAQAATEINVRLGNNGKLVTDLPGMVAISKTVETPDGYAADAFSNTDFTFDISLKDSESSPLSGSVLADVKKVDGTFSGEFQMPLTDGVGTHSIKPGETLYVYGLPEGTKYSVTEQSKDGFKAEIDSADGEIVSGGIAQVNVNNVYDPDDATLANGAFAGRKVLEGRAWETGDTFELRLRAEGNAPMPQGTTTEGSIRYKAVEVTDKDSAESVSFGDISYSTPGVYEYTIFENRPENRIPGVTYVDAVYRVWVTVTDTDLDGKLDNPTVVMKKTIDDDGQPIATEQQVEVQDKIAEFTNVYSVKGVDSAPEAVKSLTNANTGESIPLTQNQFTFKVTALQDNTPISTAADSDGRADNGQSAMVGHAANGNLSFGRAQFLPGDRNKSYSYAVEEVIPGEAYDSNLKKTYAEATPEEKKSGTWVHEGITYDNTVWTAKIELSEKTVNGEQVLDPVWSYTGSKAGAGVTGSRIVFNNFYAAAPVTLADDNIIKGSKILDGREFKESETFGFMISAANKAAADGLADGSIDGLKGVAPSAVTASKDSANFNFGAATFSKEGVYRFRVAEMQWNGNPLPSLTTEGLSFDESTYDVTVTVSDNGAGQLVATTEYAKSGAKAPQANFTNTYAASGDYGTMVGAGVPVSKTMTGRSMVQGEFSFSITGVKGEAANGSTAASAQDAQGKLNALPDTERSFYNASHAADAKWTVEKLAGLTFTNKDAGKTFSYLVDETTPSANDAKPGVTYDESEFRVDIAVVDNLDGTLSATTNIVRLKNADGTALDVPTQSEVAFVNAYEPGDVTHDFDTDANATLYKRLMGRDWKSGADNADSFDFTVEPVGNAPVPDGASNPYTITVSGAGKDYKANERVPFSIGKIKFTDAGTYEYKVTEAEGSIPGIAYSKHEATVRVVVVDNTSTGKLEIQSVSVVPSRTFTNTYNTSVAYGDAVDFTITKKLTGHEMTKDQFSFTVTANDERSAEKLGDNVKENTPMPFSGPGADGKDGETVPMEKPAGSAIKFSTADSGKTFSYSFAETNGGAAGYTYDTTVYTLAITPTDNGDGTMSFKTDLTTTKGDQSTTVSKDTVKDGEYSVTIAFENSYTPTAFDAVPANFTLTKVLTGKRWKGDTFDFVLEGIANTNTAGVSKNVTVNRSNGTTVIDGVECDSAPFDFGKLPYTAVGDYSYTVREVIPDEAVNADGVKYADATPEQKAQDTWSLHGVQYDKHLATVVVKVEDKDGALIATANVTNGTFQNDYNAKLSYGQYGGLEIYKTLNGRNMSSGQFTFNVTPADLDSAKLIDANKTDLTPVAYQSPKAKIGERQLVTKLFGAVTFDQSNVGDAYSFTIEEEALGAGYTCANSIFTVDIAVEDAGEGALRVITEVKNAKQETVGTYVYESGHAAEQVAAVDFVNAYEAPSVVIGGEGQVAINATKTLTGRDMTAGEFGFEVRNVTRGADEVVAKGSNAAAADGVAANVTFDPLEFTTESLASDMNELKVDYVIDQQTGTITYVYSYRVSEVSGYGGDTGVTQGASSFDVTVTIVDNNQGVLTATVGYPKGSNNSLAFTNFYGDGSLASVQVNGVKNYSKPSGDGYKVPDIEGKFSFTLEGENGAPMPAGSVGGKKTVNNSAGNVDFGTIAYTMENVWGAPAATTKAGAEGGIELVASAPREKVFTYTVTESGSVAGVDNDPVATREFTVAVKDDGKGNITAEPSFGAQRAFVFTNSYTVNPAGGSLTGDGGFKISKTLEGRKLESGEFEFVLTDADGKVVASAKNDANGIVTMPNLTFDKPGVYTYALAEVNNKAGGVKYDSTVYKVTATVEHPGEDAKALAVNWAVDGHKAGDELVFNNTYEAKPAELTFNAAKTLAGRDLKKGEFSFELVDGNGKVLQTVKNGAPGEGGYAPVSFDPVTFDAPGEYGFTIREVKGDVENVAYDTTEFKYHVVVTDNTKGALEATWSEAEDRGAVFKNAYEEPEVPTPKPTDPPKADDGKDALPRTGDDSLMAVAGCGAAGIAAVATGLFVAKRKRTDA